MNKPRLLVFEDRVSALVQVSDEDIRSAGMIPDVRRELGVVTSTPCKTAVKAYEELRAAVKKLSGPTICVLDCQLLPPQCDPHRHELRNGLKHNFRGNLGQVDGFALAEALVESEVSPLLFVVATREGPSNAIRADINAFLSECGRLARGLHCICNADICRDVDAFADVPDYPAYFRALRAEWDRRFGGGAFLGYWLRTWNKDGPTREAEGDVCHWDHIDQWPDSPIKEALRVPEEGKYAAQDALKATFTGRRKYNIFKYEKECCYIQGEDPISAGMAAGLIGSVGVPCDVDESTSSDLHILWPTVPGATFVWRLQQFIGALNNYDGRLILKCLTAQIPWQVELRIPIENAYHLYAALLTRTHKDRGTATDNLRKLLGGRLPAIGDGVEGSWKERPAGKLLAEFAGSGRQPNVNKMAGGGDVYWPICRLTAEEHALILTWLFPKPEKR